MSKTRVVVTGACGKMGRETVKAISGTSDLEVVGACDIAFVGTNLAEMTGVSGLGEITVSGSLESTLDQVKPEVMVDFTIPANVMANVRIALSKGVSPVIGTTGLTPENLEEIDTLAKAKGIGALVAPNFAIGAVLMMKFAREAAKVMEWVEITELHHEKKLDSPSGTAIKTAEMIADAREAAGITPPSAPGEDDPARGQKVRGVHIHSVRMPGLVAHQEVVFGGLGQTLTIRHDSIDRTSFMPGVILAVRKVKEAQGLIYGLDKII